MRRFVLTVSTVALSGLFLSLGVAYGEFMGLPDRVPVERLVKNVTKFVQARPRDLNGRLTLARIHAMAWAQGAPEVPIKLAKKEGELPQFGVFQSVRQSRSTENKSAPSKAAQAHFHRAISNYRTALDLDGKSALAHLGLAWILDDSARWSHVLKRPDGSELKVKWLPGERERLEALLQLAATGKDATQPKALPRIVREKALRSLKTLHARALHLVVNRVDDPKQSADLRTVAKAVLRHHYEEQALAHYRRAFELRKEADLKREGYGVEADSAVALESGKAILRLLSGRTDAAAKRERAQLAPVVEKLGQILHAITPIVFPVDRARPLRELLPEGRTARFDLDGDLVPETWPWVSATTGILVWAPDPTTAITSGRQLFGSATWWIAWSDGYAPLAALDDNGDGALRGDELQGLGVWQDRDGDGVSDLGEVTSAQSHGIRSITTRSDHEHDGVPAARHGIEMTDGRVLPTYDWTTRPVQDAPTRP